MKDLIYVTGHRNPDSDSICAAVAYAEFKNKTSSIPAVAVRLGEINQETQFILEYFGVNKPPILETVKLQVGDLNIDKIHPIAPEISLKMAWNIMKTNNLKTLPVVDENEHLMGLLSVSSLTTNYMDIWDNTILSKSNTTLENIIETLSADPVYVHGDNPRFTGKILVAAMEPTSLSSMVESGDIVIVGDREEAQNVLIDKKVSLMITTCSQCVTEEMKERASKNGVTIISTPHDSFTAARLIVQSVPVSYVMADNNLIFFSIEDLVEDIKDIMVETRYRSYPVIDDANRVIGMISRYHLISNHKKKVIQVDHNERSQSVPGLEDAEILEIIDHHRVADIQTNTPIYFRNEPVGSTSTIVASCFFENGIRPSRQAAGLMAAAIISDTLLLKSPTTTPKDSHILKRLCEIADINKEEFAQQMFKAGTSLKGKTVEQIFHQDFKTFNVEGIKIGVAQVYTMDKEGFMPIKDEMLEFMEKKSRDVDLKLVVLMLTDILNEGSQIYAVGPKKDIIEKAFNVTIEEDTAFLPGVVSRKKQVIPPLTTEITIAKKN
ncbi:putative manganese-dependent inorganic diphosphatase [Clostridium polynesiense]|uniref:putative manganese-dependent inorganic diphosphatase n=1 Tax=Clostridium polynesiense TaxID=1325933 RepID=UPI00059024E3|nr:putative manganese-dependent inorganic diphosphatase [Clostridium polynesiense]